MSTRISRCIAFVLDWNIIGIPAIILAAIITAIVSVTGMELIALLFFPIILSWFVLFILRDVVFGGVSIGKRIMKLKVIDKYTGEDASKKQKALRGVSLFLVSFDALFLLISGSSLGDRIASTAVVKSSFEFPTQYNEYTLNDNGQPVTKKSNKKTVIVVIVSIIAFIVALGIIITVIISSVFSSVKKSEEYALAYEYLTTSQYFDYFDLSEENIRLTGYKTTTYPGLGERHVRFTFNVGKRFVSVYCVSKDGNWQVDESASGLNTPNT